MQRELNQNLSGDEVLQHSIFVSSTACRTSMRPQETTSCNHSCNDLPPPLITYPYIAQCLCSWLIASGLFSVAVQSSASATIHVRQVGGGKRPLAGRRRAPRRPPAFLKSFCKSQLPHKFVNLSFVITNIQNKLTDLWGS